MEVVFDSSTLILLAKVEILRIITEHIKVIVPEVVREECIVKNTLDCKLISSLIEEGKIKVLRVAKQETVAKLRKDFNIHPGEAEALCLAIGRKAPVAVDDLPTIKACKILNQTFTTAIHFLIDITKRGKIDGDNASIKLEKLSLYGRYSKRILDDASRRLKGVV